MEPESCRDTVMTVHAQQADHRRAQCGHHPRARTGAYPGTVLTEGDVADPVQSILDPPIRLHPPGQRLGRRIQMRQGTQQVHDLYGLLRLLS